MLDMSGFDVLSYPGFITALSLTNSALPHVHSLLGLDPDHQLQGGLVLLVHLHLVDARVMEEGLLSVLSLDMFGLHVSPSLRLVVAAERTN